MRRLAVLSALICLPGAAQAGNAACRIAVAANGEFVTLQAVVIRSAQPLKGHYDMLVNVRRGTNASVSRQSGKFSFPAGKSGKDVILSQSRVFVPSGASLRATLRLTTDAGAQFCRAESSI